MVVLEVLSDASGHIRLLLDKGPVVGLWWPRLTWLRGSTVKVTEMPRPFCSAQSVLSLLEGVLGWMEWTYVLNLVHQLFARLGQPASALRR